MDIEVNGPRVSFVIPIGDGIKISETLVTGWIIIIALFFLFRWMTKDMKKIPEKKRQILAEMIVNFFNKTVKEMMGESMMHFAPYVATIFTFAITGALISLLGFRSMTVDINTTGTWAMMTFACITYYKFKTNGFLGYFIGYTQPVPVMTPMNILSEAATPVSMAIRMFGNMTGGMIITTLVYGGLTAASNAVYNLIGVGAMGWTKYFSIFQIGIPAVLSIYFDLFSGIIQSYVFIMLTMAYVKAAASSE
jgi:F-type H+-transporting ATPase subunit a